MCGIILAVGDMKPKHKDAFLNMLQLDTVRGPHSTGIFSSNHKENNIDKWLGTPWQKDYNEQRKFITNSAVLIGHNRWATQGAINVMNAHPFNHGSLYGVHNGTLKTRFELDDWQKFDVDSENIYYHMSKHGVEDTVKLLDGAFALVWYDATDGSTNILRNAERTFYIGLSEGVVVGASEEWMIEVACGRQGLKTESINAVPVARHLKFLPDGTCEGNNLELFKPKKFLANYNYQGGTSSFYDIKEKLEMVIVEEQQHCFVGSIVGGNYAGQMVKIYKGTAGTAKESLLRSAVKDGTMFCANGFKSGGSATITIYTSTIEVLSDADEDEGHDYYDHAGIEITKEGFNKITHGGCCWCASPVAKSSDLVWFSEHDFVCTDCAHQPEVKEYLNASNLGLIN